MSFQTKLNTELVVINLAGAVPSPIHQLESLYNAVVRVDREEEGRYRDILHFVVDTVLLNARQFSPEFAQLYRKIYYGGSFFDGLKVGSTSQEFDLNIVFSWRSQDLEISQLGTDKSKQNFCYLKDTRRGQSVAGNSIVNKPWPFGDPTISPLKMFQVLQSSVDRALTKMGNEVIYRGQIYRATTQVNAPLTLKVVGQNMAFEVDLVPSLKLGMSALPRDFQLPNNVFNNLSYKGGIGESCFMAISLHKADREKFELDFHDLERAILFDRGCVKKVIKLMKYLRDIKGGPMAKLWSHLLKVRALP